VPSGDLDVLDEQPQQRLALGVVELVDDGADAVGEVPDAAAEPVAAGEVGALGGQAGAFFLGVALACGDGGGAALQFGHADQPGLVEVDQPVVLAAGGLEPAVQAGQLGGQQPVVGDRGVHRDGLLPGQQQGRLLAAALFAHESAAFGVDVPAGLGGDLLLAAVVRLGGCRGGPAR
jgi:hypothetical protein